MSDIAFDVMAPVSLREERRDSLRAHYAGLAMQALIVHAGFNAPPTTVAMNAIAMADELVRQLERTGKK